MRAQEFVTEISRERLQHYLSRADLQVSRRLDRMSQARQRLDRSYEIYDVDQPQRIIDRFEADNAQQARKYYADFIHNYNSDVDFEFGLRRSTGIIENINNDITHSTWHAEKTITLPDVGTLMLRARNTSDVVPPQFVVDVYTPENPNKSIGHFRFLVMDWEPPKTTWFARKSKRDPYVIGGNVRVWDQYQKKGIARAVYAWVKSLGNDVRPSTTRTPAGMSMWNSFERNPLEENFNGIDIDMDIEGDEIMVRAMAKGRELGHVLFVVDGEYLMPQDLEVDERYRGQGIAATMYDYVKSKGYKIRRSGQQTPAGAGFWAKHRPEQNVWENTNPGSVKLGPQLYAPRPKNLNEALKPQAKLWTSSAKKTNLGYTSAWVKWAKSEMPGWVGDQGLLFDVAPGAKILTINSDRDAVRIARQYGANVKDAISLFMNMPWDKIAQDYDAIHHVPSNRSVNVFMNAWDVESTAWLNTDFLINQRPVKIAKSHQNQSVAEATGDERFDTMMGRMQKEPQIPDSQMPPTDVRDLYQWAVKNNKPYHKTFATWANREGFKSVAPALQKAGNLDSDALDYWTPDVWEMWYGSKMPKHWSKERIPDELRDYLETVFDAYDHIWTDWPTEYRQIGQQGVAENFADGKGPGRPGDSVRHGIPKHATMAELEKASHAKGRKGQLARWQLNMRRGHKK